VDATTDIASQVERSLNQIEYVALDDGSIWSKEQLWLRLAESLMKALEVRQSRRRKGRPAKGPGSAQLGGSPEHVGRLIREAYTAITDKEGRPAQYAEVARKLAISTTTLWRWRQVHGWPPA